jgi:DNA-directed RNA polymerase subunit beta
MKAAIGRKLAARVLKTWNEDFVDEDTGEVVSIERNEVIMERETVLTEENIDDILESGNASVLLHKDVEAASRYSIIFNTLAKDPSNSEKEAVLYIYRQLRNADPADDASAREVINNLFFSEKRYDLGEVGRYRINKKLGLTTDMDVKVLTKQDIIEIIKYLIELINSKADVDDIDHLSNRRVRTVGEQLSNQFAIGLARMSRTIRERMNVRDNEVFTPIDLIGQLFSYSTYTTVTQVVNIINIRFRVNQLNQILNDFNNILFCQYLHIHIRSQPQLLVDSVTAYFAKVISFFREEQVIDNLTSTGIISRICITQLTVDVKHSLLLRVRGVFSESVEND